MDDDPSAPEIPWYAVEQRTIFELDEASRAALRRKLRRSLTPCADLRLSVDERFDEVLARCAQPTDGDGVWITPRLQALYADLHAAGFAHSFELCDEDGALAAGILGVVIGRAAMLESMRRVRSHAGNALLSRTLDHLAAHGIDLCDIQLPTDHTLRLGAQLVPRADYEARLRASIRPGS
jgi:leucyl/phenylalanyl-tRNA--protein transferase